MLPNSIFVPRINALQLEMTFLHAAVNLGGEGHIRTRALTTRQRFYLALHRINPYKIQKNKVK